MDPFHPGKCNVKSRRVGGCTAGGRRGDKHFVDGSSDEKQIVDLPRYNANAEKLVRVIGMCVVSDSFGTLAPGLDVGL
ncbi:hypothetical protein FQR65_LT10173 [Abscondita terminalis]|nr:hypothetical protein FQR65_LT10173 [Abscondita terminalis]